MKVNLLQTGQGKPVVFFHGWGFDHRIWLHLPPLFQVQYKLILVDLPGFGETPLMDWEDFKNSLLAQLPEHFALVGWSLGGLYATRLAIEAPNRVTVLLNSCSSPRFTSDQGWPAVDKEVFAKFYKQLATNPRATLNEFIALQSQRVQPELFAIEKPNYDGLDSGLNILGSWDLREAIKSLQIPIAYIFGRLDPITPVRLMECMKLEYPNFHYVLFRKAAHMPFLSHPNDFITEITSFIL